MYFYTLVVTVYNGQVFLPVPVSTGREAKGSSGPSTGALFHSVLASFLDSTSFTAYSFFTYSRHIWLDYINLRLTACGTSRVGGDTRPLTQWLEFERTISIRVRVCRQTRGKGGSRGEG